MEVNDDKHSPIKLLKLSEQNATSAETILRFIKEMNSPDHTSVQLFR